MSYDINDFISSPDLYRVMERRGWTFNDYQTAGIIFLSNASIEKKLLAYEEISAITKNIKLKNQLNDVISTINDTLVLIQKQDDYNVVLYIPHRNGQIFTSYAEAYNYAMTHYKNKASSSDYFKIAKGVFDIVEYEFVQIIASITFNSNGIAINASPYASNELLKKWEANIDKTNERMLRDNNALPAYKNVPFFAAFIKYPKVYKEFEVVEYDHRDPELGYSRFICGDFTAINKANNDLKNQASEKGLLLSARISGQPVFSSTISKDDYFTLRMNTVDMINLRRVRPFDEEKRLIIEIKEELNKYKDELINHLSDEIE